MDASRRRARGARGDDGNGRRPADVAHGVAIDAPRGRHGLRERVITGFNAGFEGMTAWAKAKEND